MGIFPIPWKGSLISFTNFVYIYELALDAPLSAGDTPRAFPRKQFFPNPYCKLLMFITLGQTAAAWSSRSGRATVAFAALSGLMVSGLGAQDNDDLLDEGFELSPFVVETSDDVGYLSTNSTSGTSLNTAIKDLPMALQVINQEFIRDYGASDLEEALTYASGVHTSDNQTSGNVGSTRGGGSGDRSISSAGSGSRFANVVHIRGLSTPYQNRMGFRYGGLVVTPDSSVALGGMLDSVNMERIEVVKGPNSLLYGVGVLTGIVNVIPERPMSEPRYEVGVKAGSEDFLRGEFDITGPLRSELIPGQLNYRLAGSYEERGHWTDFREEETEYWVAQIEYMPADWMKVFVEYQNATARENGIGSQWIHDRINDAHDTEFRNQYDEAYAWARHEGEIPGLRALDPDGFSTVQTISPDGQMRSQPGFRMLDETFVGGGFGNDYRITGPDTFAERDEEIFIADFELYPIENLTINVGGMWSKQETFERNLTFRNPPTTAANVFVQNLIGQDDQLRGIWESGGIYGVQMQESVRDRFGLNFRVDEEQHPGDWVLPASVDDVKLIEYWWEDSLVKSESEQYRARATYTFDTPFIGDDYANHTILAGLHYINDDVDFPDGNLDRGNAGVNRGDWFDRSYRIGSEPGSIRISADDPNDPQPTYGAMVDDPHNNDGRYYRSIANFEPLYFDGRNDGVDGHNTVRAGDAYLNQEIEQTGIYGVYQGKFFSDRLELIAGVRQDTYNATQYTHKRVNMSDEFIEANALRWAEGIADRDANALGGSDEIYNQLLGRITATDQYIVNYYRDQIESGNEGYFGYANRSGAPDESYGIVPGSKFDVFANDIEITTTTFGANFDITPDITIYGVLSEGVSPNTALRDGNGDIIGAEETLNKEIGIKFDLFDRRLSGSIALFRIDRENGIWNVPIAPAAFKWADAQLHPNRSSNWQAVTYDPETPSTYFVQSGYLVDYIAEEFGMDPAQLNFAPEGGRLQQQVNLGDLDPDLPLMERLQIVRDVQEATLFPETFANQWNSQAAFGGNLPINLVGLPAAGLDELQEVTIYNPETNEFVTREISNMAVLYSAFMERELDKEKNPLLEQNHPVRYRRFTGNSFPQQNNNVDFDQAQGALVTFDERIEGVEVEFFWTATDNLQFWFNYSHIEREARDTFNFTEWRSITGTAGTFVPAFTQLHREYGWESAGLQGAWVDYDAYAAARSEAGDQPVAIDALGESAVEFLDQGMTDQTMGIDTFNQRSDDGQIFVLVDQRGNVVNEQNSARSADFTDLLSGVSLNFNPEDEASLMGKYRFDRRHGWLDRLSVTAGLKYIGSSETSMAFNSISPLNELTMTPKIPERYRFDLGLFYEWQWADVDMRLSLNVYNVFDDTYTVETTTLNTLNPITGEEVTKRSEQFHAPTSFRIGLRASF